MAEFRNKRKKIWRGLVVVLLALGGMQQSTQAGVQGYVTVHNSRDAAIRVLVNWGFRGQVAAHSSKRFLVGDDADATTWVSAETTRGVELKRVPFPGSYNDVDVWVD